MKNRDENIMLFVSIVIGIMIGILIESWLAIKPTSFPCKKILFHILFVTGQTLIASCSVDLCFQQIESIMYKRRKEKLKKSLNGLIEKTWKYYPFELQFDFYRNSLKCVIYGCGGYFITTIFPIYIRIFSTGLMTFFFIIVGSIISQFIDKETSHE